MVKRSTRPWEGTDQDRWRKKVKPRWGFLSVNGKGYLYHHFKPLKISRSLGNLLKYESEKEIRRRVRQSDDEIGRLVGGRTSPDRLLGVGLDRYRDFLTTRYQKGKISRSTYDDYLIWIRFHEKGVFKNHLQTPLLQFEPDNHLRSVQDFFGDYFDRRTKEKSKRGTHLSERHLRREITRLRRTFKFLVDERLMLKNPVEVIREWLEGRVSTRTPFRDTSHSKSEMIEKYERWKRIRTHLIKRWDQDRLVNHTSLRILLVQSLMGMRLSEVRRMEWGEVGTSPGLTRDVRSVVSTDLTELEITSKRKKRSRQVPDLVSRILVEIQDELRDQFGDLPRWVFPSPSRHGGDPELTRPLTNPGVSRSFKLLQIQMSELEPHLVSHELRNFFITDLIERGVSDREVSTYVRHSSVEMTRYYLREDVLPTDNVLSKIDDSIMETQDRE